MNFIQFLYHIVKWKATFHLYKELWLASGSPGPRSQIAKNRAEHSLSCIDVSWENKTEKLFQGKPLHGIKKKKKCRYFSFLGKLSYRLPRDLRWWCLHFLFSDKCWSFRDGNMTVEGFFWPCCFSGTRLLGLHKLSWFNYLSGARTSTQRQRAALSPLEPCSVGMGWWLWEMDSCWVHVLVSMATTIQACAKVIGLIESLQRLKATCLVPS